MSYSLKRLTAGMAFVLCCFLVVTVPTRAEAGTDQDGWTFGGSVYLEDLSFSGPMFGIKFRF